MADDELNAAIAAWVRDIDSEPLRDHSEVLRLEGAVVVSEPRP